MTLIKKTLSVISILLVIGCSSGSSSDGDGADDQVPASVGAVPVIDAVVLGKVVNGSYEECDNYNIGDMASLAVFYNDPDNDVRGLYITQYTPDDATTPYHGPLYVNFPIEPIEITGPAGQWRIEFKLEDDQGNESNVFNVYMTIDE